MRYWIDIKLREDYAGDRSDSIILEAEDFSDLSEGVAREIYDRIISIDPDEVKKEMGKSAEESAAKWDCLMARFRWGNEDYGISGADVIDAVNDLREQGERK